MKVISCDELKELKFLGYGKYSYTTIVEFKGLNFCFKKFKLLYEDEKIINRLSLLTEENFNEDFLVPLYMVKDENYRIIGYLSKYYENLITMQDNLSFYEQLELIKSAKEKIEILHKKYKRVHGDLHFKNLLCDKDNLNAYLLDFDLSVKLGELPNSFMDYTIAVQKYLKFFPFDEKLDIYHFNLCTLQYLAKYYDNWNFLLHNLEYETNISGINNDVKKLSKELLLENTKKPYSGEYIIDYIG